MSDATTGQGSGGREPPGPGTGRVRASGSRKQDWIAESMRRVYDAALEDSIPPEMLNLLNALDDEDAGGEGKEE